MKYIIKRVRLTKKEIDDVLGFETLSVTRSANGDCIIVEVPDVLTLKLDNTKKDKLKELVENAINRVVVEESK